MTSLIKIEIECEDAEDGRLKLQNIIKSMQEGNIEGEGWEVLANAFETKTDNNGLEVDADN